MNKVLQEFRELRISYSGRIDQALQSGDSDAINNTRKEYKQILEQYMNYACAYISSHTNRPFSIVKKSGNKKKLRSSKAVLRDTASIRDSLSRIKIPEEIKGNIKVALDVVEEYYNKIVSHFDTTSVDDTNLQFRLAFGLVLVPIMSIILSIIGSMIISNAAPSLAGISSIRQLYTLIRNNTSASAVFLVLVAIYAIPVFSLIHLFQKKGEQSKLDSQIFMLIPVTCLNVHVLTQPFSLIVDNYFNLSNMYLVNQLNHLLLIIFAFLLVTFGLLKKHSTIGDYKNALSIYDKIMVFIVILIVIIPLIYSVLLEFVDFSKLDANNYIGTFTSFKYLQLILLYINLGYILAVVNMTVWTNKKYLIAYRILCILLSVGALVGLPFMLPQTSTNNQSQVISSETSANQELENSFNEIVSASEGLYTVQFAGDSIIIKSDSQNIDCNLKYSISDKVIFTYEAEIKKGISYDDFKKIESNLSANSLAYQAVAKMKGADGDKALVYFSFSFLESSLNNMSGSGSYIIYDDTAADEGVTVEVGESKIIRVSEFGDHAVDYAKDVYGKKVSVSDSKDYNTYNYTQELVDITDDSVKLKFTLEINTQSDFSQINNYSDDE